MYFCTAKHTKTMEMKQVKILVLMLVATMLVAACKNQVETPQSDEPRCDVNPDEVFGAHYTAADFGLWNVLNFDSQRYRDLVHMAMIDRPDSLKHEWDTYDGLLVHASDTAAFFEGIERNMDAKVIGERYFWNRIPMDGDTLYRFLCVYYDDHRPILDGSHIDSAWVDDWKLSTDVAWRFDSVGSEIFRQVTAENVGRYLAIMLGDRLIAAPRINAEISGGSCSVTGPSLDEMCALTKVLNNKK